MKKFEKTWSNKMKTEHKLSTNTEKLNNLI